MSYPPMDEQLRELLEYLRVEYESLRSKGHEREWAVRHAIGSAVEIFNGIETLKNPFEGFCESFDVTPSEREKLVQYLAVCRVQKAMELLTKPANPNERPG